jgi:hypothetical protein
MAVFLRNAHSPSEPLWEAAVAFARTEVELALAARSGEFDAANQLQNRGAKLHGLASAPTPCFGPIAGRNQKLTGRGMPKPVQTS